MSMSSLVCNTTHCIFTRVDTNASAVYPIPPLNSTFNNTTGMDNTFSAFSETTTAPWTNPENQDKLSDTVALTRDFRGGLFNALYQNDVYNTLAPSNTEWALIPEGKTFKEARCSMTFCEWNNCFAQYSPDYNIIGKRGIVHLIDDDVYYHIIFTNWTADNLCNGGSCPPPPILVDQATVAKSNAATTTTTNTDMIAAPISHPLYPQPSDNHPGGGFRYIRDAQPFNLTLPPCPKCSSAKANPAVLSGPADDSLLSVKITGVTPANAVIVIKAVAQSTPVKCNSGRFVGNDTASQVRPNAKIDPGKSTVYLRRTRTPGEINPLTYTIYFDATSAGGTCSGQVSVCVPVVGFDCNAYLGFDATATRFCQY